MKKKKKKRRDEGDRSYAYDEREYSGNEFCLDNVTSPLYWQIFSLLYLLSAGVGIWSYFSGDDTLFCSMALTCVVLLPAGIIVDKLCAKLGWWKNVSVDKISKLGRLLYAPALLLPLGIVGFPLYYFLDLTIPLCFLITTASIVVIVLFVDTCLNLYKEQFVSFFQRLYLALYYILLNYIWHPIKNFILVPFWKYILKPLGRFIEYCYSKFCDAFEWFEDNVLDPIKDFFECVTLKLEPVWDFFKRVVENIKDWISDFFDWFEDKIWNPFIDKVVVPFFKKLFDYVLHPLYKVVKWIIVEVLYKYFLKYIFAVLEAIFDFSVGFIKVVFGWVLNDANGVVNYFITIPLIVIAVIGSIVYFFFY
ncbi:MAG: hypothetical protein UH850_05745 [Paludibacteraceae bacterium]|nr:hypothetical protein [Paludibacteraceae bacterium]